MISAKLQLLKETFESKFDIDKFKRFTREFFNEPEMLSAKRHIGIWKEYENNILSYSDIAKFNDADENTIIVLTVELKSEKGVERARSLQRNFISKILDDNNCEAAIVAFYSEQDSNWRLSFVRLDYTFKDKGLELDLTPAKRYSYLVGENETSHTAQKQLYPIFEDDKHNPTLDEIEKAFSVEKVTKDFFEQYKNKYYDLKEYLEKDEAFINETRKLGFEVNKFSEQFAKKLMGQLAFLYFLQKKGWLGVRIMSENHIIEKSKFMGLYNIQDDSHKEILKKFFAQNKEGDFKLSIRLFHTITDYEADLLSDCFADTELNMTWGSGDKRFIRGIFDFCVNNTNKNFFDDYLEPFFYEGLNKRRKNQFYKLFNCKIPFLNGGLFEPLEGYHWKEVNFEIPNRIFSNIKEKGKEADGILDIFDRYNFTINEDEPLEKEVAVDPEMLGKIFENLLDGKDRKAKGAFYTPREVVHYMCQESIINYLVNKTNVSYEDMKEFILYGEIIRDADNRKNVGYDKEFTIKQSIFNKIVQIDQALENIKVADPAVGSGAFPLGMLNEIVRARNNITEYIIRLDKEGKLDRRYGEKVIRKIRSSYIMKWKTIKNSIFAVDIEPSAVDIAKLRLWLSVVVEQEIDEENKEPHPLPNLDCNIMVGNSLIDEYEGIKLFDETLLYKYRNKSKEELETHDQIASTMQLSMLIDYSDQWMKEMFELQNRLFDENDADKKKDIKERIDKIRDELIEYKLNRDGNKEGLKKYKEMKKLKMRAFFIWELEFAKVFKENGGFDVVIGNPPYIKIQNINNYESAQLKRCYKTATGKFDIYVLFIEKAFRILRNDGVTSYIQPHRFLTVDYGKGTREFLIKIKGLKKFIHFGVNQVFETATTYTGVFFYSFNNKGILYTEANNKNLNSLEFNYKSYEELGGKWLFKNDNTQSIILKIQKNKTEMLNVFKGIFQGVITAGDDIFILEGKIYGDKFKGFSNALNQNVEIEAELMKPLLKGENIRRYKQPYSNMYIFYPHYKNDKGKTKPFEECEFKNKYPRGYDYISNFKNQLIEKKIKYKTNPKYWYSLHRAREIGVFDTEKIITPQLQNYPNFTLDYNHNYPDAGGYSMVLNDNIKDDINYYLGILNSSTFWHFIKSTSTPFNNNYYYFKSAYIEPFCFPDNVSEKVKIAIVQDVNQLKKFYKLGEIENQNEIVQIQNNINGIIYELYHFNDEEIQIIENSNIRGN